MTAKFTVSVSRVTPKPETVDWCDCEGCVACATPIVPEGAGPGPCCDWVLPPRTICRPCSATEHVQGRRSGKP